MEDNIIKQEFVVNWKNVFVATLKRWWIIIICLIIGVGAGFGAGSLMNSVPRYECSLTYLIGWNGSEDISTQYGIISRVMVNCTKIVTQNAFHDRVKDEANSLGVYNDFTSDEVKGNISVSWPSGEDTVITLWVVGEDPDRVYEITRAVENIFASYLVEKYSPIGGDGFVCTLINNPEYPDTPNARKNNTMTMAILGGVAAAAIAFVVLMIIQMTDVRIRNINDIKDKYNVPILGTAYNFENPMPNKSYKYGGYKYAEK